MPEVTEQVCPHFQANLHVSLRYAECHLNISTTSTHWIVEVCLHLNVNESCWSEARQNVVHRYTVRYSPWQRIDTTSKHIVCEFPLKYTNILQCLAIRKTSVAQLNAIFLTSETCLHQTFALFSHTSFAFTFCSCLDIPALDESTTVSLSVFFVYV